MTRKHDHLKRLLKKVEMDRPSMGFTNDVMREIDIQQAESPVNEPFSSLLRTYGGEAPSSNFNHITMAKIRHREYRVPPPLIPRRTWYWLAAILVGAIFIVLFPSTQAASGPPNGLTAVMVILGNWLTSSLSTFDTFAPILLMAILTACVLLGIEHLIKKRWLARRQ